jgi:hypothetical protein
MAKLLARFLLGWLALGAFGCSSNDELEDTGGLAVVSISALPFAPENAFEVEEAWVALRRVDLVPCGDEGTIGVSDFPADLLNHPPVQALYHTGLFEYCSVHLEIEPALLANETEPHAALVHGKRADGVSVEIESNFTTAIDVAGQRFDVSRVVLGFDLTSWLSGIDLDALEPDADGRVLIDSEHDPDLLDAFDRGLELAPALYRDLDADGLVGPDELTPIATPE